MDLVVRCCAPAASSANSCERVGLVVGPDRDERRRRQSAPADPAEAPRSAVVRSPRARVRVARVLGRMESPAANTVVECRHRRVRTRRLPPGCDRRAPGAGRHRMAFGRVRCRAMPTSSEVRRQLTVILGGVILIVLITLIPDLAPPSPDIGAPVEAYKGEILEIIPPDVGGSEAGGAPVFTAQVLLLDGALKGQTVTAFVEGPGGSQLVAAYAPGDQVVVTITQDANEPEPYIAVADRWRFEPIAALIILFAVGVIVVGGWQGVRALVALGLTIAVILKIILPLILAGRAAAPDGGRRRDGDHGRDDPAHGGLGQGQRRGHPWHGGLAVGGGPASRRPLPRRRAVHRTRARISPTSSDPGRQRPRPARDPARRGHPRLAGRARRRHGDPGRRR